MDDEYACCKECDQKAVDRQYPETVQSYKVDISAFIKVHARNADDAWVMVNGLFSSWFYQKLQAEGISIDDGEISIDEAYLDESELD